MFFFRQVFHNIFYAYQPYFFILSSCVHTQLHDSFFLFLINVRQTCYHKWTPMTKKKTRLTCEKEKSSLFSIIFIPIFSKKRAREGLFEISRKWHEEIIWETILLLWVLQFVLQQRVGTGQHTLSKPGCFLLMLSVSAFGQRKAPLCSVLFSLNAV